MNAIDIANAEQRKASDPRVSAFVAASAGSGKTKLLTDRLLRLMLAGSAPEKILCLTYTKAAAAEMRIRLNKRLGEWVVKSDAALGAELAALNVPGDADTLSRARKLFADVLDLPGGMRIETIHAFCQSLLRRFPLEAGLSPHFEVADDETAARRLREAREAALADAAARAAVYALAAETNEQDFAALTEVFVQEAPPALRGARLDQLIARQRAALGAGEKSSAELLKDAVSISREDQLREILRQISARGTATGIKNAYPLLDWLALPPPERAAEWNIWVNGFLTDGKPRTFKGYCGPKLKAQQDSFMDELTAEAQRILMVEEQLKAARLAALNAHLLALLLPIAAHNHDGKALAAHLSYGDLVTHAKALLVAPGAAWVLYKLDGGIEHLLLDEVQDTAPAQWEIASALAAEFFAGEGARGQPRSIFAVGDAKQSIFSFQGADLHSFGTYRAKFKAQALGAGRPWLDGQLSVSFRSTAPVLALTDAVFAAGLARDGVVAPGETLHHEVSRVGQAGRVMLWPLTPAREAAELPDWGLADGYEHADSAKAALARALAEWIAARLRHPLPSHGRLARPGDFLILVRHRDELLDAITAQLKARAIPVAGLDRMMLTQHQAVSDLLALCDALLLPDDDLAFGQFLVSPLGGLDDASLMELALYRGRKPLVQVLYARAAERAEWQEAKHFFEALRAKADFLPPYALLAEALGPLGGRAKLLRRLGAEAAEPIDELLAEALAFAARAPGALQAFVFALRQTGASIKRETEAGGNEVRMMTVHGAKGLQAPIVILPDTTSLPKNERRLFWLDVPQENTQENTQVPVFCPRAELRAEAVAAAAARAREAARQEYNRLLYVALTRAEDELLICGAAGKHAPPETCWYEAVRQGFDRLATRAEEGALVHDCAQSAAPDRVSRQAETAPAALPAWLAGAPTWQATPPAREATRPERIIPSRSVETAVKQLLPTSPLAAAPGARLAAVEQGIAVHALLQHLPALPPAARAQAAQDYLTAQPGLAAQAARLRDAVLALLQDPALAPLFGPGARAEAPLAGVVGEKEIGGIVDRLAVTPDAVWLADYKTDRAPPATPAAIPPQYLSQLAAYRAVLRQLYPRLPVRVWLIWVQTARAMEVPPAFLDGAAPA